jgi:hypothetical protein
MLPSGFVAVFAAHIRGVDSSSLSTATKFSHRIPLAYQQICKFCHFSTDVVLCSFMLLEWSKSPPENGPQIIDRFSHPILKPAALSTVPGSSDGLMLLVLPDETQVRIVGFSRRN